jgi:hypothetical protein
VRIDVTPILRQILHNSFFVFVNFVLGSPQCSPILILLFKHSRKYEGVRKFVSEKLSYIFVFGSDVILSVIDFPKNLKKLNLILVIAGRGQQPKNTIPPEKPSNSPAI